MIDKVVMSDSPHIRKRKTTKCIMLDVIIALIPATVAGIVFFGLNALLVLFLSTFSAVATEVIYSLCLKKNIKDIIKEFDFTSVITGLLLGLTMPSGVNWYIPVLSAIFAIAVVKMLFGGTGKNIVNPAIAGRVFAFIAFLTPMTTYILPNFASVDSGATQLTILLQNGIDSIVGTNGTYSLLDAFLGINLKGCIGETCKLAILIGGIYLIARKVIKWQWPVLYILSTGLMSVVLHKFDFAYFMPSIMLGGLFFGAVFMATDYVTSPSNNNARYVYFILLGIVTAALRYATKIEVVSFAILLMNLFVPLFNRYIRPRAFGAKSKFQIIKEKMIAKKKAKLGDGSHDN